MAAELRRGSNGKNQSLEKDLNSGINVNLFMSINLYP